MNRQCLTLGAELEFADIDRHQAPPSGCGWDEKDYSMVNSNGIAVDPKGKHYRWGGEVKTRPTSGTVTDQVAVFKQVLHTFPDAKVNYRSNLHIHVGIPGLVNSLESLKSLQAYIHRVFRPVMGILEPIPKPIKESYLDMGEYAGAHKRYLRRRRSHQTFLTPDRLAHQLQAKTIEEFFRREVPASRSGAPQWQCQPRCAVNLRQLLQTNTVEFRHFPGTRDVSQFQAALQWCIYFISAWAGNESTNTLAEMAEEFAPELPAFAPYNHMLEKRYLLTTHDGSVPKAQIRDNINRILNNDLL